MRASDPPDVYLKQAYLGEIRGEWTFRELIGEMPARRQALERLAEVERATAAYLRPYLTVAVSENDEAKAREAARKRVAGLTISSWQDLVQASLPIVEAALKIMKQAEKHAPNELLSVYGTYRAHEQALADYLHAQQNGAPGDHFLFSYLTLLRRESAQASR